MKGWQENLHSRVCGKMPGVIRDPVFVICLMWTYRKTLSGCKMGINLGTVKCLNTSKVRSLRRLRMIKNPQIKIQCTNCPTASIIFYWIGASVSFGFNDLSNRDKDDYMRRSQ